MLHDVLHSGRLERIPSHHAACILAGVIYTLGTFQCITEAYRMSMLVRLRPFKMKDDAYFRRI